MARLRPSTRTRREEETQATAREMNLRTAVLGVAAIAAGYAVGRRLLRMRGGSTDSIRERAGEALPGNGVEVPIGGTGDDEGSEDDDAGAGADEDEPAPGADPSLEEIDERTEEDVEGEPAEPGEMQVDEDLVDEAIDEDETEE